MSIHEIASHWVLHNTELCHNLFTFQVDVIPHISLFLQAKGLFVARRWILQYLKKNMRTYQRLSQTRVYKLLNKGLKLTFLKLPPPTEDALH